MNKPDHISNSQINLCKCPYKYLKLRLEKSINEDNIAMQRGAAVHEIIAKYTDWCVKNRTDGDAEELDRIIDSIFNKGKYPEEIYQEIRETIIKFGEREMLFKSILDYERMSKVKIGTDKFGKEIMLDVVIDRVNSYRGDKGTVLEIIDYKNQMNILTKADVDKHEQLKIYKYVACKYLYKNYDYVRVGIYHTQYNFIRWGEMEKVSDLAIEFDNTEKYLIRQWEWIINRTEYKPIMSEACWQYGMCPVMSAGKCPLWTKERTEAMRISDKITDMIAAYRKLDSDSKELKKKISKHFETAMPEEIHGKLVGYQQSISTQYVVKQLLEYCKKYDINFDEMTISKTEAEKIISQYKKPALMTEDELNEIKAMQKYKVSSSFKI